MDSGVEHAPGAGSCACSAAALAATSASVYEANFRITQIYTSQFGGGPRRNASIPIRQKGRRRVALRRPCVRKVFSLRLGGPAQYPEVQLLAIGCEIHFDLVTLCKL